MRRRSLVLAGAFAVGAVAWLIIDADSSTRDDVAGVWNRFTAFLGGEDDPPNWGDVAERVGTFADEERELREALDPPLTEAAGAI